MTTLPMSTSQKFVEFLTIREVAGALKISDRTVRRWIQNGELIAHRLGMQWRIDPRDLDTFLKIRRITP